MKAPKLPLGPLLVNPLLLSQICKADGSMQVANVEWLPSPQIVIDYARLFAAAPELLTTLVDLINVLGVMEKAGDLSAAESLKLDRARAAANKAIGSDA